jgi:multiple sugar transport system permease protein/raffinose/stachyose/melibiose transport system permease protein
VAAITPRRSWPARLWRSGDIRRHLLLLLVCVLTFYPFAELIVMSLKSIDQFEIDPFGLSLPFHLVDNYSAAWDAISPYIFNSIIYSGVSAIGVLAFSSFPAYVFARFRFPLKEVLYYLIISLLMIPPVLTLVPQYVLISDLHLLNSRLALILPYIAGGQVFGIFLLRSFYANQPQELFEAAHIDGAGELQTFWRIALPLARPILGTLAVLNVVGTWNDIVWPTIVFSDQSLQNLSVGLTVFESEYNTNWGPLFAGYVIAALPLLLLFAVVSRWFIEGLSSGALKV